LRNFGVVGFFIELPGVVIWQHINSSTHNEKRADKK